MGEKSDFRDPMNFKAFTLVSLVCVTGMVKTQHCLAQVLMVTVVYCQSGHDLKHEQMLFSFFWRT